MAIQYKGQREYLQVSHPIASKNEWGTDVLAVRWNGDITKLAAFIRSLNQGSQISYSGAQFYLQTWQAEEGRAYGPVMLFYKGFLSGVPPDPFTVAESVDLSGTASVDDANITTPNMNSDPGATTENRTYEFTYVAQQKTLRAITNTEAPPSDIQITVATPVITRSFYTNDAGQRRAGLPPNQSMVPRFTGVQSFPIIGTPWWEHVLTATITIDILAY